MIRRKTATATLAIVLVLVGTVAGASPFGTGPWAQAVDIELSSPGADAAFNSASLDGCPFPSRDGKSFFMASDHAGGLGGLDIWVSSRKHTNDVWGAPVNLGAPINSAFNDFCPTIAVMVTSSSS